MHKVTNLDAGASQLPTPPAANPNLSLPLSFCPPAVGATVVSYLSPTFPTPIEWNEPEVENQSFAKKGHSYVIYVPDLSSIFSHESWYCREGAHEIVYTALAVAQSPTDKSTPADPVVEAKASPRIPPRIVGSKRKFVEDRSTYSNSINPARKRYKPLCVLY